VEDIFCVRDLKPFGHAYLPYRFCVDQSRGGRTDIAGTLSDAVKTTP
jgi:hypothetical protein